MAKKKNIMPEWMNGYRLYDYWQVFGKKQHAVVDVLSSSKYRHQPLELKTSLSSFIITTDQWLVILRRAQYKHHPWRTQVVRFFLSNFNYTKFFYMKIYLIAISLLLPAIAGAQVKTKSQLPSGNNNSNASMQAAQTAIQTPASL